MYLSDIILFIYISIYLSIFLSNLIMFIYISIYISIYHTYLSIFITKFNCIQFQECEVLKSNCLRLFDIFRMADTKGHKRTQLKATKLVSFCKIWTYKYICHHHNNTRFMMQVMKRSKAYFVIFCAIYKNEGHRFYGPFGTNGFINSKPLTQNAFKRRFAMVSDLES